MKKNMGSIFSSSKQFKTEGQNLQSSVSHKEEKIDRALRPQSFAQFIGQQKIVHNLTRFLDSAQARSEVLDHVLFFGPPGLGKTTLAHLIARSSGAALKTTSGPMVTKPGDVAALLTGLQKGDVLFIDEIHRLPVAVEEVLYGAMEDYKIDIMIGEGAQTRSIQLILPPFTLVGATTRYGLLSAPLRDRFGITMALNFYTVEELTILIQLSASQWDMILSQKACRVIARSARGTPRVALRLLRRIRDFLLPEILHHTPDDTIIETKIYAALKELGINMYGLDLFDQRYMVCLGHTFKGGPVGIETLAAAMHETRDSLEDTIEPFLIKEGYIQRTPRGRLLTDRGNEILATCVHDQ